VRRGGQFHCHSPVGPASCRLPGKLAPGRSPGPPLIGGKSVESGARVQFPGQPQEPR
jgi:hypothetical protein